MSFTSTSILALGKDMEFTLAGKNRATFMQFGMTTNRNSLVLLPLVLI